MVESEFKMVIKILGSGCSKCKMLEKLTLEAVSELGAEAAVEKVQDIQKIMGYGIMSTPALVINDKVKVYGRVPSLDAIKQYIKEEL
jgi:small redox-active disulfide protein 2